MCFSIKLGIQVSHSKRMDPIDFWVQRSKVKVKIHIYGNKLVNTIEAKPLCAFSSNLECMLAIVRGWNPIDFGGKMSKVKVTIEMYENRLVNTIETKPLCASSSNLADMLTMVRGWTLLILEVTCQMWRPRWASFTNMGCAGMLRFALLYLLKNYLSLELPSIVTEKMFMKYPCPPAHGPLHNMR